ncbi:unnamed protein product [Chrysoparadoxa australica]
MEELSALHIGTSLALLIPVLLVGYVLLCPSGNPYQKECIRVQKEKRDRLHRCLAQEASPKDREGDAEIIEMSAGEIQRSYLQSKWTCERVLMAFIRRSRDLARLNAVTEELFDEAVAKAKELDQSGLLSQQKSYESQPLLGVPISVKDSFVQKGTMSTCGMSSRTRKFRHDGLVVELLRDAGAVPFVKTNVPQCLMMVETDNRVFGRTENPWMEGRTCGGSSGGEGALLSARGSPLGIGSDVGGSIRTPAAFCGITGFKPTPLRLTRQGMATLKKGSTPMGQQHILVASGPMGRFVSDLRLMMRALVVPKASYMDPYTHQSVWDDSVAENGPGHKLRVGIMRSDGGFFNPCQATSRAVAEAAKALSKAGHEVVEFYAPSTGWEIASLYYGHMGAEGNMLTFVESLDGEPFISSYKTLYWFSQVPNILRPLISWIFWLKGEHRKSALCGTVRNGGLSTREYYERVVELATMKAAWVKAVRSQNLDAVLLPGPAMPAFKHGGSQNLTGSMTCCFLPNLLAWPSGMVPVTQVKEGEDRYDTRSLPALQRDSFAHAAHEQMVGSVGLPVGAQLMTLPQNDELCLYAMAELERAVGFTARPGV